MVAFYNPGDQELYKQFQYLPQEKYRLGLNLPKAEQDVEAVTSSFGIPNTNAFTGNKNKNYFSGSTNQLINDFNAINQDKYMNSQKTPNVDMNYNQKLQSNFMGMPSYRQQELTGPDLGEYIGGQEIGYTPGGELGFSYGTEVPLEQTTAGKIQSGLQSTGRGIKNLMEMLPTPSNLLNKFGIQNFNTLSPLDQQYINQSKYYTGPTVFGENNSGLGKDPFGINTDSMIGNYAQYVRDLVASGKLKGDRKTFYEKEVEKQEQNKKVAIANERRAGAAANAGTQRGGGAGDSSTSHMGGISQSQADAVGKANKDAGMGGWGLRDGGRAGYFFGGRVNYKNGGLASIL
jgi:hypothetical protein